MSLEKNVFTLQKRIAKACKRVGRNPNEVKILAVSKYANDQAVGELSQLGIHAFGENRIQQARKRLDLFPALEWHFIGSLQTNKVKYCQGFSMIHSLDRWALANEVNQRSQQWGRRMDMLLQVNISGEASKHGLAPKDVLPFAQELQTLRFIRIRGLMGMAPYIQAEQTRPYFQLLKGIQEEMTKTLGGNFDVLSMGMSNDYAVAIEEGATLIRVGTTLFGEEG